MSLPRKPVLEDFVEGSFDLATKPLHVAFVVRVDAAVLRWDRVRDDVAKGREVWDRQEMGRARQRKWQVQTLRTFEGIADEIEEIVRAEGRYGNERSSVAERGANEAVTLTPKQCSARVISALATA